MAWNPLGGKRGWNTPQVDALGTQPWEPASGVEQSQENPYPQDISEALQKPQAFGLNLSGFVNPYSFTLYQYGLIVNQPVRVVPPNLRRCYLILQNQGPGNIFINFGQDVTVATITQNSNGMQLIQTQIYEQIGGGGVDAAGNTYTQAFVSPDYVSITTDTAGTTVLVGEGIWRYVTAQGASYF